MNSPKADWGYGKVKEHRRKLYTDRSDIPPRKKNHKPFCQENRVLQYKTPERIPEGNKQIKTHSEIFNLSFRN